ncbi:MAG: hypothetical protein ACI33S_04350 [Bacilli bacterium]
MSNETIEKLKQFQSILKTCILDRFKNNLPQDKIDLINKTDFVNIDELKSYNNALDIQGAILRKMLYSIIHITCNKDIQVGNETKSVEYGKLLNDLLVEHFAIEISGRYKFQIISDEKLRDKLTIVNEIKKVLGAKFESLVLTQNAKYILSIDGLKEIEAIFDVNAIDEANKPIQTNSENTPLQQQNSPNPNEIDITDYIKNTNNQNNQPVTKTIQDEKYEELVMRYARGEKLSEEELKMLLKSTPDLMTDSQIEEFTNNNVGPKLEMTNSSTGFSYFKMILYFIVITNILGFIIATLLTHY